MSLGNVILSADAVVLTVPDSCDTAGQMHGECRLQYRSSTVDVLVVDDDRAVVAELMAALERVKLVCAGESDPWEALHLMASGVRPAAIVVDIRMPELNGLEFVKMLSPVTAPQRPEVIFVSGCAVLEDAIEAFRLGASDLLKKPIDLRRLVHAIKDILLARWVPGAAAGNARSMYAPSVKSPEPLEKFNPDIIDLGLVERSELHELFGNHPSIRSLMEPIWKMLLEVYRFERRGEEVLLNSLCRSAQLQVKSALWQIRILQDERLLEQYPAKTSHRRRAYCLTDKGRDIVESVAKSYGATRGRMH